MAATVLGLSASLRNARFGAGSELLVKELKRLRSRYELGDFLRKQARIRLDDFVSAGRSKSLSFDEIYRNLQTQRPDQGLSNSEVVLAAGLWGALQVGCDIKHIGLSHYFPANRPGGFALDELKAKLLEANALLVSTPVYFGDRSSVAHDLVEMIRRDPDLREAAQGNVYGGMSVGAKRNGGQETTLVYMLLDMTGVGMLGVGNDSQTTSQYGGTALGGDVGTVGMDEYGLDTSVGVGKRIGHVASVLKMANEARLEDVLRVQIWLLQDAEGRALREVTRISQDLRKLSGSKIEVSILDATELSIHRCIACDVCPTHVDRDEAYRCIIRKDSDAFKQNHNMFLEPDAVIVAALSPGDRDKLVSRLQRFLERTRYLRRGDYVLSDTVVAPLVLQDLDSRENLHLRILTSMLRHHTIMTHPIIGYTRDGHILNRDGMAVDLARFIRQATRVATGKCVMSSLGPEDTKYMPIGYVLSAEKDSEAGTEERRAAALNARTVRKSTRAIERLRPSDAV